MTSNDKQSSLVSILALNIALHGDDSLEANESKNNIIDNIVNIYTNYSLRKKTRDGFVYRDRISHGCGLQITTDGYVITTYHNVKDFIDGVELRDEAVPDPEAKLKVDLDKCYIQGRNSGVYTLDSSEYYAWPGFDIALVKAEIPIKPAPIRFQVVEDSIVKGDRTILCALDDLSLYRQHGQVIKVKDRTTLDRLGLVEDTFLTDSYILPGFSGGVFITPSGGLMGLALYGVSCGRSLQQNSDTIKKEDLLTYAGGARVKNLIDLVTTHVCNLARKQF